MKIGRVRLSDHTTILVTIDGDNAHELVGAAETELVSICMARKAPDTGPGRSFPLDEVEFLTPVVPGTLRDFMAFEAHVRNCVEGAGGTMNQTWYDEPVFYFGNPRTVIGNRTDVRPPRRSRSLDYELEVAAIVGTEIRDLDPEDPHVFDHLAGFALLNDWSARDLAGKEMKQGLGPAKGKDFATSLGPWVVTPDEIAAGPAIIDTPLTARVNDEIRSEGTAKDMHFTWGQILARASEDVTLYPGDVIGSGTVGSGCLLELRITHGKEGYPWLQDGDEVILESPVLGQLRNTVRG